MKIIYILMLMVFETIGCTLQPASEAVSETASAHVKHGVFLGSIMRSPACAAMTRQKPCPAKPAAGTKLAVTPSKGAAVIILSADADGRFRAELEPGVYRIGLADSGIEFSKNLPTTVVINAGGETHLEILLDSGIR